MNPLQPHCCGFFINEYQFDCKHMNIMYVSCALIYEYESDLRSKEHYLSRSENKSLKNLGLYGSWRSFSYSSSIYLTSNFYLILFCSQSMRIFSALLSLRSSKQCVRAPLHQLALNRTNQSLWQSTSRTQGNQGRGKEGILWCTVYPSFVPLLRKLLIIIL